jgi:hypothetical protein
MPANVAQDHCRFLSSLGAIYHCSDPVYREGFCRFHFQAFRDGEVLPNGQLNERLTDQHRRREINYHGVPPEAASPTAGPVHR